MGEVRGVACGSILQALMTALLGNRAVVPKCRLESTPEVDRHRDQVLLPGTPVSRPSSVGISPHGKFNGLSTINASGASSLGHLKQGADS